MHVIELLAKTLPFLPRWLVSYLAVWIAAAIPLVVLVLIYWSKGASASSRTGDGGTVIQESKGANSPNIVGNNNVINIAPATKPTSARGRLQIEDRSSKETPHGVSESITFGNTGSRDTYVIAIRIRDRKDAIVVPFRKATGKVQPGLPVTIKPGNTVTLTIDLTKEQASQARWVEWQSENETWNRIGWNERLHHIDVSVVESVDVSGKVDVKVTRAGTSGGAGGSKPDAE